MTNKKMEDLLFSSIDEVRSSYEAREVSPVEVLEATLTRLEELEPMRLCLSRASDGVPCGRCGARLVQDSSVPLPAGGSG